MKTPVRTRLLSALLSLVMLVSLLPVSVFAAEPASGTWEKVTEAQEDWSGQYLIVYEKGSLIMDGSLSALDKEGNKVDGPSPTARSLVITPSTRSPSRP